MFSRGLLLVGVRPAASVLIVVVALVLRTLTTSTPEPMSMFRLSPPKSCRPDVSVSMAPVAPRAAAPVTSGLRRCPYRQRRSRVGGTGTSAHLRAEQRSARSSMTSGPVDSQSQEDGAAGRNRSAPTKRIVSAIVQRVGPGFRRVYL